jgi:hypothetical protein
VLDPRSVSFERCAVRWLARLLTRRPTADAQRPGVLGACDAQLVGGDPERTGGAGDVQAGAFEQLAGAGGDW